MLVSEGICIDRRFMHEYAVTVSTKIFRNILAIAGLAKARFEGTSAKRSLLDDILAECSRQDGTNGAYQ